jgi:hypothetical protein
MSHELSALGHCNGGGADLRGSLDEHTKLLSMRDGEELLIARA